jgi:hypothetical protein
MVDFTDIAPGAVSDNVNATFVPTSDNDKLIIPTSTATSIQIMRGRVDSSGNPILGTEGYNKWQFDIDTIALPWTLTTTSTGTPSYIWSNTSGPIISTINSNTNTVTTQVHGPYLTQDQSGFGPLNIIPSTRTDIIKCRAGDILNIDATISNVVHWYSSNPYGSLVGYDFTIFYRKNGGGKDDNSTTKPWSIFFQAYYENSGIGSSSTPNNVFFAAPGNLAGLTFEVPLDATYEFVMGIDFYAEQSDSSIINYPTDIELYGNSMKIQRTRR